ncbi:hypothetical protein ACUR5C_07050 [Aliikangiella sp. IMCC44653]
MKNQLIQLCSCLVLISLIACGGAKPAIISNAEIASAAQNNNLPSLYAKIEKVIAESSGSSKKEAINIRSKIVGLLVTQANQTLTSLKQQQANDAFSVTRKNIVDFKNYLSDMQNWSATDYARIAPQVDALLESKNQAIASLMQQSEQAAGVAEKVNFHRQAAQLAGANEPEAKSFEEAKKTTVSQMLYVGSDALAKRLYSTAKDAAKTGLAIDAGNIQFESMLSQAQAGLFEKDFRFALENGKPESAYQAMMAVADEPIFMQLKKSMQKSILVLANYFSASAHKAYQQGDLLLAYDNFNKGRNIQRQLSVAASGFIQEKQFLDLLMQKSKQPNLNLGEKQTLLRVIAEFDPAYPGLKTESTKLLGEIKQRAMTKLSIADFKEVLTSQSALNSVGRRIGSKLERILFEQLGNEVSIVTADKLVQESTYDGLALKIDGEVLQAAIETNQSQGKRTLNVRVGTHREETEDYQDWARRKRGEAPKQYNETPIMENVELVVKHIKKLAVAEVAYRIVEPSNGSILLTDTISSERQFSGESIDELQKGEFHQAFVDGGLPSDIKIMDNLATELAQGLGKKLNAYLETPENVFYKKANEAKAKGNNSDAIEFLANAVAIAQAKGLDVNQWLTELKSLTLSKH